MANFLNQPDDPYGKLYLEGQGTPTSPYNNPSIFASSASPAEAIPAAQAATPPAATPPVPSDAAVAILRAAANAGSLSDPTAPPSLYNPVLRTPRTASDIAALSAYLSPGGSPAPMGLPQNAAVSADVAARATGGEPPTPRPRPSGGGSKVPTPRARPSGGGGSTNAGAGDGSNASLAKFIANAPQQAVPYWSPRTAAADALTGAVNPIHQIVQAVANRTMPGAGRSAPYPPGSSVTHWPLWQGEVAPAFGDRVTPSPPPDLSTLQGSMQAKGRAAQPPSFKRLRSPKPVR